MLIVRIPGTPAPDGVLDEKIGTNKRNSFVPQVGQVEEKVEKQTGEQGENRWIKCGKNTYQQKEIDRMEDTEADIGDPVLNRLKLGEITEHSPDVEAPGPYDVQEIMVRVDEDAADGEEQKL